MSDECVRDKALRLASIARGIGAERQDDDTAHRVGRAVQELKETLAELAVVVQAARKLNDHGADIAFDKLDDGLALFIRRAGDGLPSSQAVTGARRTVSGVRERIRTQLQEAWRTWHEARFAELHQDRIPMLAPSEAPAAGNSLEQLRKLARVEPRAAAIAEFVLVHTELRRQLDEAAEPEPEILELLERLRVGTTLDNLSDDDIALLRDKQLASAVEVRRRSV